jgi:hypothetical protein
MATQRLTAEPEEANHPTVRQLLLVKLPVPEDSLLLLAKPEQSLAKSLANRPAQAAHLELREKDFVFHL